LPYITSLGVFLAPGETYNFQMHLSSKKR